METKDLAAIIKAYRRTALGSDESELSTQRMNTMDHYYGRPYGDEQEGRSQVVSRDLMETIDWVMPAIMDTFLQSGKLAEFKPIHPQDEEQARIETEYVNHVIMQDNMGYILIHDFIHDALLQKNGYIKHWWDESERIHETEYEGLTEIDVVALFQEYKVTNLQSVLEKLNTYITEGEEAVDYTFDLEDGGKLEIVEYEEKTSPLGPIYDLTIKITQKVNRCKLEACPPNEVRVSRLCRGSLQESPFTEHNTRKSRSELLEMGMDKTFVKSLPAMSNENTNYSESTKRNSVTDEDNPYLELTVDESMQEVEYSESYLKVDWDGDGKGELRKIIMAGNRIPDGEEWNEPVESVGLTSCTAMRMPHRHVGFSLDDKLDFLQRIKTVLWRQLMDNVYNTNNQETVINERANIPDFLQSLPGGIKRVTGEGPVQDAVMPYQKAPIAQQV